MKILYFTNIPSPYRVNFFSLLGEKCDLTVVYELNNASDRDESWNPDGKEKSFKEIFLNSRRVTSAGGISLKVVSYINKSYDFIVVGTHGTPCAKLLMAYMRFMNIPYILNIDGMLTQDLEIKSKINKLLRSILFHGALAYIVSNKETTKYLRELNIKKRVYRYHFSSIYQSDIVDESYKEKKAFKKEIGMQEKYCIVAVGSFTHRKGFDTLISAFERLNEDVGLYLIGGDGEYYEKDIRKISYNKQKKLYFIEFLEKNILFKYYQASDLFVLPTRHDEWGLVVNEALACGLPIITTFACGAGLEIIKNDINGYLIDEDDSIALETKIRYILNNDDVGYRMKLNNIKIAHKYTLENMVEDHIKIFKDLQNK